MRKNTASYFWFLLNFFSLELVIVSLINVFVHFLHITAYVLEKNENNFIL